jgi:hypothetical protein
MSEFIYTEKKPVQYHGPLSSTDFNERSEQNYADLVYLYNKYGVLDKKITEVIERVIKENIYLSSALSDLKDRIRVMESINTNQISIHSKSQVNLSAFANTSYAIPASLALEFNDYYNTITLPKVSSSSHSKIKFVNSTKGQVIPDFLETRIDANLVGGDGNGALIDTTPVQYAFLNQADKVWRRNVILNEPNPFGVSMYLYIKIPTGTIGNSLANYVSLAPYPSNGVDVVRVEYTTAVAPTLTDKDTYQSFNPGYYNNEYDAVGRVAPGGWSTVGSDTIVNSGPLQFITADKSITAVRILLRQRNYIKENNSYIYTYGLSDVDIRYEKYLPTGKTFVRFDAPTGNTIREILNISPKIYNVSPSMLSGIFGYRIFYPVLSGSQTTYSLVNPETSDHVYVEVTLNMLDDMIAPVLSDLIIEADYNL